MNKQEQVQQMTTYMANFVSHIAKVLPDDIIAKLDELGAQEDAPLSKTSARTKSLKRSASTLASSSKMPIPCGGSIAFLHRTSYRFFSVLLSQVSF